MGERKGQNKYYPPDYDPKKGGLNAFLGTHALRERARKIHLGILIIRFEMPYNIWCDGCQNHIGMGVRYNAEKTKVGMYYSTPVYQFKMKCHLCDNYIEMKTDPGNLDYIIVSGARRQERRWDPTTNEQVVPEDKRVSKQLNSDPMFKLAHVVDDKKKSSNVSPTLALLADLQERKKDDYMANRLLRDQFRAKKKELKKAEDEDNSVLKKFSLNIPLLKESEEDQQIASLLRLQPARSSEDRQQEARKEIEKRSNFPTFTRKSSSEEDKTRKQFSIGIRPKSLPVSTDTQLPSTMPVPEIYSKNTVPSTLPVSALASEPECVGSTVKPLVPPTAPSPTPTGSLSLVSCDYNTSDSNSE